MNREQHLNWCKLEALEELQGGDCHKTVENAIANLRKHPDTADHPSIEIAYRLVLKGQLNTLDAVHAWIVGFQ